MKRIGRDSVPRSKASRSKDKKDFDVSDATSLGGTRFGKVHESLLLSPQWQRLRPTAQVLYITIITHLATAYSHKRLWAFRQSEELPETAYNDGKHFIMSQVDFEKYGISGKHGHRWMRELCEAGFCECVENNQHRKRVNIYKVSDAWKGSG